MTCKTKITNTGQCPTHLQCNERTFVKLHLLTLWSWALLERPSVVKPLDTCVFICCMLANCTWSVCGGIVASLMYECLILTCSISGDCIDNYGLFWNEINWLIDTFPAFYGTQRFNTEFTWALHIFLSWARLYYTTFTALLNIQHS
jgi:hypothetical protein